MCWGNVPNAESHVWGGLYGVPFKHINYYLNFAQINGDSIEILRLRSE